MVERKGTAMRYRRLGSTGLEVSVIGLGTWQFSGEWGKHFTQAEVDALVGRAGELSVNLIDTAECYGDHLAESLVGPAIAADRDRWAVATKFGHRFHAERMREPGWDRARCAATTGLRGRSSGSSRTRCARSAPTRGGAIIRAKSNA
jgi:aryl-alcohol dehydrogenase-like predicted oxidoreductase